MTLRLMPILCVVLAPLSARADDEAHALPGVADPHGDPAACTACHAPAGEGQDVGPALPIVETCRSCHPTADMHPVGIRPDEVHVAEGFPLENGLLSCATCHVEPAHGGDAVVPPPYHRGGPYDDVRQLCYSCHERSSYTRTDPHHPAAPRDRDDPTCAACHSGVPADGATPDDARLRFPTSEPCKTCHEGELHQGVPSHVGKALDPDARVAVPTDVPLARDGTVQCWSCHDVHGFVPGTEPKVERRYAGRRPFADELHQRLLDDDWAGLVPADAIWPDHADPDHPPLLALPITDGSLCKACHGDGP